MILRTFVLVVIAAWLIALTQARSPQYVDPFCVVLKKPVRDPAEQENVYNLKRTQKCNLYIGGGSVGILHYALTKKNVPIVKSGIITISKKNLDRGAAPAPVTQTYINYLSRGDQPGQILGSKLGGPGTDLSNIFPQNVQSKLLYDKFEDVIYNCLSNDLADDAVLRWTFYYLDNSATRPYQVLYQVKFNNGKGSCANDLAQKLDN